MDAIKRIMLAARDYRDDAEKYKQLGMIKGVVKDDLVLLSYTDEAQYSNTWGKIEMVCRGLIINWRDLRVVARPFDKFFNFEQLPVSASRNLLKKPCELTVKLDGSLGIGYYHKGEWRIATKRSFDNHQATWATEWLHKNVGSKLDYLGGGLTLLFEVIYPENRVIVNYYDTAGLYLIGVRTVEGSDYNYGQIREIASLLGVEPAPLISGGIAGTLALAKTAEGVEGWVARFNNGLRVKIKTEEYRRLHRLLTGLSPKRIREAIIDNSLTKYLVDGVPEHYRAEISTIAEAIRGRASRRMHEIKYLYGVILKIHDGTRKGFAQIVMTKHPAISGELFALYDGKDISEMVLERVDISDLEMATV